MHLYFALSENLLGLHTLWFLSTRLILLMKCWLDKQLKVNLLECLFSCTMKRGKKSINLFITLKETDLSCCTCVLDFWDVLREVFQKCIYVSFKNSEGNFCWKWTSPVRQRMPTYERWSWTIPMQTSGTIWRLSILRWRTPQRLWETLIVHWTWIHGTN